MEPDTLPDDPVWGHCSGPGRDGVRIHFVRRGAGPTVLLLHGWPGFWYDWRRVIGPLSGAADVIAPDFRGFGDSSRPQGEDAATYGPANHADDISDLLDSLGVSEAVLVGHDIGASVAQVLARRDASRFKRLVLFNPPYPGIGARRFDPAVQGEFWYQHFHNVPGADEIIGRDRETTKLYLSWFYRHWVAREGAVRPAEFEAIVDKYAQPGAVRSANAWYRARAGQRAREASSQAGVDFAVIGQPAVIRWGAADPVMKADWADRLGEFFSAIRDFRKLDGVGHFVPFEAPEEALAAIQLQLRG